MKNTNNYSPGKFFLLLIVPTLLLIFSCNTPIDPYDALLTGRRDYTWEADTLVIPFTILHHIWGSGPNDVWAIGPGGDLDRTIFHFDGEKWHNDGISRSISPLSIWGFAQNDVWLAGNEGKIWHFDGTDWSESLRLETPKFTYSGFLDIWGETPDNIWTVGYLDSADIRKGLMYHYNGNNWKRINIDYTGGQLLKIRRGRKTNDNYYLTGLWESDFVADTIKLLEFNGSKTMKVLKKSGFGNGKWMAVQEINDEIIFTINNKLYTYNNNKFELFITNPFPNSFQVIVGRNKKDIFWLMDDGITHFNGNDFKYVLNVNSSQRFLGDGLLFKNHVFFLAVEISTGLNIIHRGKTTNLEVIAP